MQKIDRTRGLALLACAWACATAAPTQAQDAPKPDVPEKIEATPADVGKIWESTAAPATQAAAPPVVDPATDLPAVFDRGLLVDRKGFSLYVFDGDRRANVSTCYGVCRTLWPPHVAAPGAEASGDFTVLHRRDGDDQWAWRGKPLYRWARDKKPGDITGDEVNKVWHVVRDEN